MKKTIEFLKKLISKKTCSTACLVKNGTPDINFADMKDLKKYFTPFMCHCLNLTGIEDLAGVDRGTVKKLIAGKKVSDEDLKMIGIIIRMIKNS
jgi:hypothetical protein